MAGPTEGLKSSRQPGVTSISMSSLHCGILVWLAKASALSLCSEPQGRAGLWRSVPSSSRLTQHKPGGNCRKSRCHRAFYWSFCSSLASLAASVKLSFGSGRLSVVRSSFRPRSDASGSGGLLFFGESSRLLNVFYVQAAPSPLAFHWTLWSSWVTLTLLQSKNASLMSLLTSKMDTVKRLIMQLRLLTITYCSSKKRQDHQRGNSEMGLVLFFVFFKQKQVHESHAILNKPVGVQSQ